MRPAPERAGRFRLNSAAAVGRRQAAEKRPRAGPARPVSGRRAAATTSPRPESGGCSDARGGGRLTHALTYPEPFAQSGLDGIKIGKAGIEVVMQTPLDFLNIFRVELRASGIRFAITSGMACVHYGLQQTTKDSDWIVPPDQVEQVRGLFVRHEASLPSWAVRYRSIFGAPLEAEWIAGGWTSHLSVRTEGGGPDHHVDFFGRPPRVKHWNADPFDPDFAAAARVAVYVSASRSRCE
jgi:hypothetical protein